MKTCRHTMRPFRTSKCLFLTLHGGHVPRDWAEISNQTQFESIDCIVFAYFGQPGVFNSAYSFQSNKNRLVNLFFHLYFTLALFLSQPRRQFFVFFLRITNLLLKFLHRRVVGQPSQASLIIHQPHSAILN